jgi:ATP-dependent Lhr-like helicase
MVQLLIEGWYEPIAVGGLHASTLVQQLLSLIAQHGGLHAAQLWEMLGAQGAFSHFPANLFASLLRELGRRKLIFQDATDLILLAERGEKICSHYSFYAAFTSQAEFRIVSSGRTLGSMPINRPLTPGGFVIFGGRRWQVISVSQEEMLIDVKPGAAGALPSFEGAYAASIHRRVRQQMRGVLCADAPVPFIDQAGRALLDEARDNYRRLGLEANRLRQAGADVHLFLWSGDRIQDTLALLLQAKGFQATNHGIFLEVRAAERHQVESALGEIAEGPAVTAIELAETVQNKVREKWDELLPDDVLDASFAAGNLDVAGAVEEIRRGRDSLGADRSTADV